MGSDCRSFQGSDVIQAPKEKEVRRLWLRLATDAKISLDKKKLRGHDSSKAQFKTEIHFAFRDLLAKMSEQFPNLADSEQLLKRPIGLLSEEKQPVLPQDSAVTKAEKIERNGANGNSDDLEGQEPVAKRVKMEGQVKAVAENGTKEKKVDSRDKVKGIALVKTESVAHVPYKNNY